MNEALLGVIDSAISDRITLQFSYQNRERVVCPYLLAKTNDNRYVCHGLQIAGNTSKGALLRPEWRYFYLDQFDNIPMASIAPFIPPTISKSEPPAFVVEIINHFKE